MAEERAVEPPRSFWIISGLALLWNLLGLATYLMYVKMTDEALAALPDAERMLYENTPEWVTAMYAIAVTAGTIGSALLLLRKSWAVPVLLVSLIAVLVQASYTLFMSSAVEVLGVQAVIMPLVVVVIGVFLVWYSRKSRERGWIT